MRYFRRVKSGEPGSARDLVRKWAASGRYLFSTDEISRALGVSDSAARAALRRLKAKGEIASPHRGFHLYVPAEYQSLGCLPPEQFVSQLMERLSLPHYAGLLTAARYHGAAHQQPQQFQVLVPKNRPAIRCGRVEVEFVARHNAAAVPTERVNTPRGFLQISSPEATAFDLVGYHERCGGLDNVVTVLAELAEKLDPERLAALGPLSPIPWAQRLGHLLDRVGQPSRGEQLAVFVARHATETASLVAGDGRSQHPRDERWKLRINAVVEPDL
ncbi:MAG: type IV toxin-antitoxin system AbiEi family antitoxin [Rhodocyclaceae bacterium]|nr:type IV toxin-antitoxin system AbiEi family antitoxin [Rhodocyclaceae bacterium]